MNKKNELLQVVAEMHYQAAGDWDIARSQAKNWADRLSTLTAQGGEIPQILRDSLEEALKWSPKSFAGADAIRKFQELAGDYVQRLIEEGTTPPAPGSSAVDGELRKAAEIVCLAAAAKNVLAIMRGCERLSKALASTVASGHAWQADPDVPGKLYCPRCDVTRSDAGGHGECIPAPASTVASGGDKAAAPSGAEGLVEALWQWMLNLKVNGDDFLPAPIACDYQGQQRFKRELAEQLATIARPESMSAAPAMPEEARLIAEAAEVLQMVADSGVALPRNWRWPLLDELSGLAAILAAASAQGDGDGK